MPMNMYRYLYMHHVCAHDIVQCIVYRQHASAVYNASAGVCVCVCDSINTVLRVARCDFPIVYSHNSTELIT